MLKFIKFLPKYLFCFLVAKPIVYLLLGLNLCGRENLPKKGPAIIVANHNSHLDGIVIMSLFPLSLWHKIRPIGAADYFFRSKIRTWLSKYVIGIIPIRRGGVVSKENLLKDCQTAINDGDIVIIFPEGTRGEPENLGVLHKGFCHLSSKFPEVPIVPIFLHGLGKSLPKGEALLVPFFVDVVINEHLYNIYSNEVLLTKIKELFIANNSKFLANNY